jgi:hypothetical protein
VAMSIDKGPTYRRFWAERAESMARTINAR